jgi:hypothetical protein
MDGNQGSACGNIHSRRKLQKILSGLIAAAYEDRNSDGQTYPLTAFDSRRALLHSRAPLKHKK